jgi:hypothetical protein
VGSVQELAGAAGLKGPQGIGCWLEGQNDDIEVASTGVGRRNTLPMPQH